MEHRRDGRPDDEALDALRRAFEIGLACPAALLAEPEFARLRGRPAYIDLVGRVEARSRDVFRRSGDRPARFRGR